MKIEDWLNIHFDPEPTSDSENIRINCPFCRSRRGTEDTGKHMYVSTVINACHCFRCDYKGTHTHMIMDHTGVSYGEAMDEMATGLVPLYKLLRQSKAPVHLEEMPDNFLTINEARKMNGINYTNSCSLIEFIRHRLRPYIYDCEKYLDRWGVWEGAKGYGKLVIPVERGWWQVRSIMKSRTGPKYLSSTAPKEDRLYNYEALGRPEIYVAEGCISAACLEPDAIALCGKTATAKQLERMRSSKTKKFTICLDSDALAEMVILAGSLSRGGKEVWLRIYKDGDPASSVEYRDLLYNFRTLLELGLSPRKVM